MLEKIEKYAKLLPFATLFLIIASSIKLAIYYSVFNINIVDYLSVSEYIPLFIDDIHSLLYVFGTFLLGFAMGDIIKKKQNNNNDKEDIENPDFNKFNRILYLVLISVCVILLIYHYLKLELISDFLERALGVFIVIMILTLMLFTTLKKSVHIALFVWLITLIFAPIVIKAYQEAYIIVDGREKLQHIIKLKGDHSNNISDLIILGNSDKYIFLYDRKNNVSIIKPNSAVEEIRILRKE